VKRELEIYSKLNHDSVVKLIGYNLDAIKVKSSGVKIDVAYMVMELV
jgi:hypothetical protein